MNEVKTFNWKPEYKKLIGLNSDLMDDIDSDSFAEDFKEVNMVLQELNDEVNK